jgi:hypothetical protein
VEGFRSLLEGSDPSTRFLLRDALAPGKLPPVGTGLSAALFAGSVRLVMMEFSTRKGVFRIPAGDATAIAEYLALALPIVHRYVGGRAANCPHVDRQTASLSAPLASNRFSDADLQEWCHRLSLYVAPGTALLFVAPEGVVHSDCDPWEGATSYHSAGRSPYLYLPLVGTGLTVDDSEGRFSLALSHALAELLADPAAEFTAPELCDGGGPAAAEITRNYFSRDGSFLGSGPAGGAPAGAGFQVQGVPRPPLAPGRRGAGPSTGYPPPVG